MVDIEDMHLQSDIFGVLISNRYGGTLIAFKDSRLFNKKTHLKNYKENGFKLILDNPPSAKIKKLLEAGYHVLHCNETGAYYYSADGK